MWKIYHSLYGALDQTRQFQWHTVNFFSRGADYNFLLFCANVLVLLVRRLHTRFLRLLRIPAVSVQVYERAVLVIWNLTRRDDNNMCALKI